MTLKIRKADVNDVAVLAGLIRNSYRDVARRFGLTPQNCPKHPSNCTADWIRKDFTRDVSYYILEHDGRPAGCVALERPSLNLGYLERLAVLPSKRHKGFGRILVDHIFHSASTSGIKKISIGIIAAQTDLKHWYQRIGFIPGETKHFDHLPFAVTFMTIELRPGIPADPIPIEKLLAAYSALLLDAYGVLVHASGALPGAAQLIDTLNRTRKPYYILTNDASKLPATAAKLYQSFGLKIPADKIITSGSLLVDYFDANQLEGAPCAVLGPTDSARYVELAGGKVVAAGDPFEVLVIGDESGYPFLETVDSVLSGLFERLDRGARVHLLLPNPDLIYPKDDHGYGIASGSIALIFEAALQRRYPGRPELKFVRLGKPHPAIFTEALNRSGTRDMVMIGDQLETDIRGAAEFGLDTVLVGTGISHLKRNDMVASLRPTYYLQGLAG